MVVQLSLAGCDAKLTHARRHFNVLNRELESFSRAHPVRYTVGRNIQEQRWDFFVWNVTDPDPALGLLIGDCAHNARTALDHLVFQLSMLGLARDLTDEEARQPQFPFADTEAEFKKQIRHIKHVRPIDQQRIEDLQFYKADRPTVWGPLTPYGHFAPIPIYLTKLHALDIIDKHRSIVPTWMMPRALLGLINARELGITTISTSPFPAQEGALIGSFHFDRPPPEPPPDMDVGRLYPMAICLQGALFPVGIVLILRKCLSAVQLVLDMFEPAINHGEPPGSIGYWDDSDLMSI